MGAPQKMRRQDAATPGPTNQVFVGDAHGLRLPHIVLCDLQHLEASTKFEHVLKRTLSKKVYTQ